MRCRSSYTQSERGSFWQLLSSQPAPCGSEALSLLHCDLSTSDDNHLISTSDFHVAGFTLGKDSFSLLTSQEPISFPQPIKEEK